MTISSNLTDNEEYREDSQKKPVNHHHYPDLPRLTIRITSSEHYIELESVGFNHDEAKKGMDYLIIQQKKIRIIDRLKPGGLG